MGVKHRQPCHNITRRNIAILKYTQQAHAVTPELMRRRLSARFFQHRYRRGEATPPPPTPRANTLNNKQPPSTLQQTTTTELITKNQQQTPQRPAENLTSRRYTKTKQVAQHSIVRRPRTRNSRANTYQHGECPQTPSTRPQCSRSCLRTSSHTPNQGRPQERTIQSNPPPRRGHHHAFQKAVFKNRKESGHTRMGARRNKSSRRQDGKKERRKEVRKRNTNTSAQRFVEQIIKVGHIVS